MSFRMQNSSFRLAALGTFTFKCKLAECAPQSRLAVSSLSPSSGGSFQPLSALAHSISLSLSLFCSRSLYSSSLSEDVGDMAEAPGFNILHLKCSARAREMQNSSTTTLSAHPPLPSLLSTPTPVVHNDSLFQHGLDLKRANLSSTTRPTLTGSYVWSV